MIITFFIFLYLIIGFFVGSLFAKHSEDEPDHELFPIAWFFWPVMVILQIIFIVMKLSRKIFKY